MLGRAQSALLPLALQGTCRRARSLPEESRAEVKAATCAWLSAHAVALSSSCRCSASHWRARVARSAVCAWSDANWCATLRSSLAACAAWWSACSCRLLPSSTCCPRPWRIRFLSLPRLYTPHRVTASVALNFARSREVGGCGGREQTAETRAGKYGSRATVRPGDCAGRAVFPPHSAPAPAPAWTPHPQFAARRHRAR
jgi:hypothetical protein